MRSSSGVLKGASGVLLTAAAAAAVEAAARSNAAFPELLLLLLPGVLLAGLIGSLACAAGAVVLATVYAAYALSPSGPLPEPETVRLIPWLAAFPILAFGGRAIHRRSVKAAAREERAFLDAGSPALWITREDGEIEYSNKAFRREFPDGPPREGETRVDNDLEVLASGRPMEILETYGAPGTPAENWLVYRFPLPVRDGFRRLGAIAFDATERARAEEGLRQREVLIQKALDGCPEAVILLAPDLRIRTWNARAAAMLGWTRTEAKSLAFESIFSTSQRESVMTHLQKLTGPEAPAVCVDTVALRRDHKELAVELTLLPLPMGKTFFVGVYLRDLSRNRRLDHQGRQARKMEAMGRLAGGVAHDFNNLLTAILGYGTMLRKGLPENHALKDCVDEILQSGRRAADLTRQLLAFSRKQVMDPKVMDLNHVVREMEKMLRRLIGEHIRFETTLGADLGSVRADYGQIEQVIMNLAVNARDAMMQGGTLAIRTANVEVDASEAARYDDARPGPFVMMAISDNGRGIDPGVKSHVFEPFFTTKGQGKGTGLGLSTVYGIVKQSGGHLRVHSEPGQGTTFEVFLPRVAERAPVPNDSSALDKSAIRGAETILVVEDSDTVRALAVRILKTKGYTVLEAPNGPEALQISKDHSGRIDILLTDVIMPGMNGQAVASRLREQRPRIRVLFTSGYPGDAFGGLEGLGDGAAFLQKPFTPYTLGNKIREVLDAASGLVPRLKVTSS